MHPSEETLLAVASGFADLPHRILVEGHLDSCPACSATMRELSTSGGALLAALPGEAPPEQLWEKLQERVRLPPRTASPHAAVYDDLPLPGSVRQELPLRPIRWRSFLLNPGLRFSVLLRDAFTGSYLILGHMAPKRVFPRHIHAGPEDVLVLAGGYGDDRGSYEAGTYTAYEPGSQHTPATEPDEGCWTLIRMEKPNRFLGWRGVVLALFT
jgi:putative transcriptional regulator